MESGGSLKLGEIGSVFVPVLVMSVFVLIITSQAIGGFATSLEIGSRERTNADAKSLETHLQFLFKEKAGCQTHLLATPFADELQRKIDDPNHPTDPGLVIRYPAFGGVPGAVLAGPGAAFMSLRMVRVQIPELRSVSSSGTGFLAKVQVDFSATPGSTYVPRSVAVPIYLLTDGAGQLSGCYMSRYARSNKTIEDQLCQTLKGPSVHWDPQTNRCEV